MPGFSNLIGGAISAIFGAGSSIFSGLSSVFGGFGNNLGPGSNFLDRRVPGVDINAKFAYKSWFFAAEYVTAATRFHPNDLLFNDHGALPSALNAEAAYSFHAGRFPMSVAFGYGFTDEAYALNLPRHRVIATMNASFIRDTIQSIEVRHEWAYKSGTTGAGRVSSTQIAPVSMAPAGRNSTTITGQVGVYF